MGKSKVCTFVSVWDGRLEISSPAFFDPDTGLIANIQTAPLSASMPEECQHLLREYVIIDGHEYDVRQDNNNEYYALRTFGVFFTRCGYAEVKAMNVQDAIRIADQEITVDSVSWDDDWHPTDAQLEDELHEE